MADILTPRERSERMRRVGTKDTKPEVAVRQIIHGMGYRYRLHRKDLPGTPDLVFVGRRKVIFVHGCFWHGHGCRAGRRPQSNQAYWNAKLTDNQQRDEAKLSELQASGWECLVVWQCDIRDDGALRSRITAFLETRISSAPLRQP